MKNKLKRLLICLLAAGISLVGKIHRCPGRSFDPGTPGRRTGTKAPREKREMRDVVRAGSGTGRFVTDRILPSDRTGGVRTSRCRQYIDRRFESPGNRIGRRLLSAGRTGAQHRKGVLHRRDPAKFGHHLPDLRFRPAGCSGQFPGVAYRIGTRSDRFRIFRKQPHNVRSGEQSGSPACHHALLYYVAIYPDRTNTLRLVGNGLFRGNSSASGEWFIDRQRRQSNQCPAGRNLVVARIDAMDRNHSAYGDPAPTDKPDLEDPEFQMKPTSPDRANMVIILRNHAPGTPLPHHDTDQSSAQETARYSHRRKTPTILRRIRPCLRKRSGPHITPTIIFG